MKAGLPANVIRAATDELTCELMRCVLDAQWSRTGRERGSSSLSVCNALSNLRTSLVSAYLKCPSSREKRVLDLLGVRVQILDAGSRTAPVRVKIEGRFFDLASLLENVSLKGDASSTCMEPQGIVEDAVTRRRGVM